VLLGPRSPGSGLTRAALLAVVVTASILAAAPADAAAPKLSCRIAKAAAQLPGKPVWFPSPQPFDTTLTVPANAKPTFARGLKWQVETRYFFLVRLPNGGNVRDPRAKAVFSADFSNLGRSITIQRRGDGRLFAQFPTTGKGKDTTVVVSLNMATTEFGEFLSSLRKVRWPTGCGTA
jgi:hypothetical protein